MEQEVSTPDIIFGSVILVIFLAVCYVVGSFIAGIQKRRFARSLAHLQPVLNGTFDTNASVSSAGIWGSYQDREVHVLATPGVAIHTEGGGPRYNAFDVEIVGVSGAKDWELYYGTDRLMDALTNSNTWYFQTRDAALKERLQTSGIIEEVQRMGPPSLSMTVYPVVKYRASGKGLSLREDITPETAPSRERLIEQIESLERLAKINERINSA